MYKYLTVLLVSLILVSCTEADLSNIPDSIGEKPIEEEPIEEQPVDETSAIGLQFYGTPKNRDYGIGIFKTSYGYLSIEGIVKNDYVVYESLSSNMIVRKLDENLMLIEENIVEIDTDEVLREVKRIDEETYVIAGKRYQNGERLNHVPVIRIIKDTGEVFNTIIIVPTEGTSDLDGYVSDVSISNGNIYAAVDYNGALTSIVAFDLNLNEQRQISFNRTRYGKIYKSGERFYYFYTTPGEEGISNILNATSLDFATGDILWSNSYENIKGPFETEFRTSKIIGSDSNLYFIGQGGRETSYGTSNISQGTVLVLDVENGEEKDRLLFDSFWRLNDAEIIEQDLVIGGWTNESRLKIVRTNVSGDIAWEYEYGPFQNENVKDFLVSDNKVVFIGNVQTTNVNDDTEVVYGILNVSQGKLQ